MAIFSDLGPKAFAMAVVAVFAMGRYAYVRWRNPGCSIELDEMGSWAAYDLKGENEVHVTEENGLSHLGPLLDRLLDPNSVYRSLILCDLNPDWAVILSRDGHRLTFVLKAVGERFPEFEEKARTVFAAHGIAPIEDGGHERGQVLEFGIPMAVEMALDLCQETLRKVCGVREEERLAYVLVEKVRAGRKPRTREQARPGP